MGEWTRVFTKKSIIAAIFLILVANAFLLLDTFNEQFGELTLETIRLRREEAKQYETVLAKYDGLEPEEILEELSQKDFDSMTSLEMRLFMDYEYISTYKPMLAEVQSRAEDMKIGEIFTSGGDFAWKNIEKTAKDFKKMEDVTLRPGNYVGFQILTEYEQTEYLVFLFLLLIMLVFYEERKKGLWNFVYATPSGRKKMGAVRTGILCASTVGMTMLLWIENLIFAGYVSGGLGDLGRSVQSIPGFDQVTLHLSVGSYLLVMIAGKMLTLTAVGLFTWFAISVPRHEVAGVGFMSVFLTLEYVLFIRINSLSMLSWLKYVNVFAFADSSGLMKEYWNLNFFGIPVEIFTIYILVLPVLIISGVVSCIFAGRVRPIKGEAMIKPLISGIIGKFRNDDGKEKTERKKHRLQRRLLIPVLHESYKAMILQGGILILLLFSVFCVRGLKIRTIYYSYSMLLYRQYMDVLEGPYQPEKKAYLESEAVILETKIEEERQNNGEQSQLYLNLLSAKSMLNHLIELSDDFESLTDKGIVPEYVNNIGYNQLYGEESETREQENGILIITVMCLACGGMFAYEHQNRAESFLGSMRHGRGRMRRRKYILMILYAMIICMVVYGTEAYEIYKNYGLEHLNAPAQSVEAFLSVPLKVDIITCLVSLYILRLFAAIAVGFMILFVSEHSKGLLFGYIKSLLLFVLPAGMAYLGADVLKRFSILNPMGFMEQMRGGGGFGFFCFLGLMAVIILAALCVVSMETTELKGRKTMLKLKVLSDSGCTDWERSGKNE